MKILFVFLVILALYSCQEDTRPHISRENQEFSISANLESESKTPSSTAPNLLEEILSERNSSTLSPIAQYDFRNFTYPLPRGWQDIDSKEAELKDGVRPILMPESKNDREKRIGLLYLTQKFLDIDSDGTDETAVILQVQTGGASIPHLVYIFKENQGQPKLIWYFRTGDRADGGLKNIYVENGLLTIELYGKDRYIIGEVETAKINGDEEQICCPTHFTKSQYKWDGKRFILKGKRLTYSLIDRSLPPVANMIEVLQKQNRVRK
ncbi:MAG: hypothetical protein N2Z23_06900 [Pyrinomonadaceae bacterium]|nr:hypothetical protein [Pyrinomonadaceae bacterium]MCX7640151.1 hypothetical protein [Pyrinomonadaceae bacterium]MDW8303261.1 hypothetical protein [Acidobacteriota bacterium]